MKKRILVLVTAVALMVVTSVAPASAKNTAWVCVNPTSPPPADPVTVHNEKKMEELVALGWTCQELPPREKVDKPPKPEPI